MTLLQENYNEMSNQQLDIWSLIQSGYFEQACEEADKQYDQTKDIFILRNKVYALLHLKRYEEVILLTSQLIESRNGETSSDYLFCGIANWLLDKRDIAVSLWKSARTSMYQDAGGGIDVEVILYFASIKTGNIKLKEEVISKLTKLLKKKKGNNWPKPLGQFILGDITSDELLSMVSTIPILKERNLCQAYFVFAIKELEINNVEGYVQKIKEIINLGSNSYLEQIYYLSFYDTVGKVTN